MARVCLWAAILSAVGSLAQAAEAPEIVIDTQGLPPRSLPEALPARPVSDWVRTHLRIGHLPPGLGRMPEAYARAGYNVITINALRKWELVGPSAPLYDADEVRRADDYLRQFVALAHGAGAKAILYIGPVQVPGVNPEFVKAHPDWLRINADGKTDSPPNFANIHSGYVDWLLKQLAHVVREYQVDGFWLDGYAPVHLHTFDAKAEAEYRAFSGDDLPRRAGNRFDVVHDKAARRYLAWHEDYFVRLADRMREAIRAVNSQTVIFVNHSANRTWYYPEAYMGEYPLRYSGAVDVSSVELYWDVPGDPLYQPFVYAFLQSVTRNRGATVWIQPQEHGISGVSSAVEIQLRGLEGAPWGVYPEFVESTGREEYLERHATNVKAREEWWVASEPVPYAGIVVSEQTRTLYGNAALPLYVSHPLGAFRALVEAHLPVQLLTEVDLEDADLRGVRVLMLPNVACLSDRACEVMRRFVRAGGGLVASFETSLYDDHFERRHDFALADLFHAHYAGSHPVTQRTEALQLMLADAAHDITDDPRIRDKQATAWRNAAGSPPERGPLALIASAAEVRPDSEAQTLVHYQTPDTKSGAKPLAAVLAGEFGRGRVVYLPASFDKAMFFYPDGYQRRLLINACRWAAGSVPPPAEVRGPLMLCATFRRQPQARRIVVHLLNHASSWGMHSIYQKVAPLPQELAQQYGYPDRSELRGTWPIREEIIPLHQIEVVCRMPGVRKATLQPEGQELALEAHDGGMRVIVPRLEMHSMVVFEGSE